MSGQVGPGGGQVGPGGGQVGPAGASSLTPPSGVLTLVANPSATDAATNRATVGPGGGQVGPGGGQVGPGAGFILQRAAPPAVVMLTGGVPLSVAPSGVVGLEPPNPDQAPTGSTWIKAAGNPILEATEAWEGSAVLALRVIAQGGFYRGWYVGGDPSAVGYATCAVTDDPTVPANWTKDAGNPIFGNGSGGEADAVSSPCPVYRGGLYRMFYTQVSTGDLYVTTSLDGKSGWSTPIIAIARPSLSFLTMAHNNDYAGGGSFDNYLHAFTSADGLSWSALAANTQAASIYPASTYRDPSLLYHGGKWWICATGDGASTAFGVLSSSEFDAGWAHVASPSFAAVGATAVWAPHWFVDIDDSVHVLAAVQTSGSRKIYEIHPTNPAMTTWSTPVLVGGTGWASNSIDPDLTFWDGTYYLFWKDDGAGTLCLSTSSSPFSGYAAVHTGDWAGWKVGAGGGSIEGPKIVDLGDRWRLYFSQNSGYEANDIYCSETTDRTMATGWTTPAKLPSLDNYNHPLPIIRPGITEWGSTDAWFEDGSWKMLLAGADSIGRWHIYYAESLDGLGWTLGRGGAPYSSLRAAADGAAAGPRVRQVDNAYHVWFHAAPAAGNLPTDIYHSSTIDLATDAWSAPVMVLQHAGSEFEIDQVARPDIVVENGMAYLFYDGADTGAGTGAIGAASVLAIGGVTILIGEDPAHPGSVLEQLFNLGVPASELHQLWDFSAPPAASELHQFFDLSGLVGSALHQLFDVAGPVASRLDQLFDIVDVPSLGGDEIAGIPLLWYPLMIFDKAGVYIGSIKAFNVVNAPIRYLRSMRITNDGGMTFSIPRSSPDIGLVASDRLVLLQSRRGEDPWIGTMAPQASVRGVLEVECRDAWALLRDGPAITLEEEVSDNTPATALFAKVMALHNDARALTGEVNWELDLGGSRPFRGDAKFDADTLTTLETIIGRSRTEMAWRGRFEGGRLVPTLVVRDRFDAGAGAAIFDGPGGNIVAGVQVIEDPSPLVFSIRLRGETTELAKCLPAWAQWAIKDITPEVTVSVDPGDYRNRQRLDDQVDWGLSKAALAAQCNAILDWLYELYHTFLRAVHDIEGRPWHEGWAYLGPPDIYEPMSAGKDSLSRRAWKTRLQLVETFPDEPASAVMISEQSSQINLREWLIVRYNRVTGVQTVTVWAIPSVIGATLIKWTSTGSVTLYRVSGGRVVSRSTTGGATGAFVDPYNIRVYDPLARRYRNLRRIVNGPFALAYYVDPADPANTFVDLGADAAISQSSGDGSSLIDKIYPFERLAIENWDPRQQGIGQLLAKPTVFFGSPTTRPRWHITSFDVGGDARTSLTHGISASETDIEVESILGFPDPDLDAADFPFLAAIDEGLDEEQILVLSMTGTLWHVARGQGGTSALIHEAGAPVRRFGVDAWDGFPFPYSWPEGEQWAREELEELSKPRIDLDVHVSHEGDDQLTLDYGSSHAVDVATEGAAGRWTGTGRAIGWSTDAGGGETEVVLEWQQ
jgi:hypothetical protein